MWEKNKVLGENQQFLARSIRVFFCLSVSNRTTRAADLMELVDFTGLKRVCHYDIKFFQACSSENQT